MRISILGGAGFIGTNLIMSLMRNTSNEILAVDQSEDYFNRQIKAPNVQLRECQFHKETDFKKLLAAQEVVYHLISTNNPSSSNHNIGKDIAENILISINILEACAANHVKKVIFISSGGTVYGDKAVCPIKENASTNPINTYGIQKLTIEKLFYLYHRMHGLEYSIIRLANPYGPYQRPDGKLGVVTTFLYKALKNEVLTVYGDGKVIRDYIYIDDAVDGVIRIANSERDDRVFNLGSGKGTSVNQVIHLIQQALGHHVAVRYIANRSVDVPSNVLDITKYRTAFGIKELIPLEKGIKLTLDHLKKEWTDTNV
ncbi:MAG: NAD-dependent epimerase/dehydratase family protein [Lachnospiraceae bacterium]|jgi:UDP-glucose 4-epimerase|nr:NAD-dependent epimerase/dehydratase family protein [Lachnospiraceae bacterium]